MRKALKVIAFTAFTFILFLVVASVAFYYLVRVGEFRRFLISEIERQTDLKVQLGEADLELGEILGITFRDLALSETEGSQPGITAERMTARVALLPLFQRKLIFFEVRLHKPNARLSRNKEGRIPLLDKLLNLPFLKQEGSQFALDLRTIKIENGEVDFQDPHPDGRLNSTRIHDVDLELERIRGERLRDFVRELMQQKRIGPQGAALEFDFKGAVERDARKATLRAKGKMIVPQGSLGYRNAWWNASVQSVDLTPEMLLPFAEGPLAIKSMRGFLAPRFHVEGSLAERIRVKGEVAFKQLTIDAPEVFAASLTPGDGRADLEMDWTPRRLQISRMDLSSKEIKLALKGEVRSPEGKEPHLWLALSAPSTSVAVIKKYLPLKFIGTPQLERWVAALQEGELQLNEAEISGSVSELRRLSDIGMKERARFVAELRNIAGRLSGDGFLPFRGVHGRVRLEQGVFSFQDLKGHYGKSWLADGVGKYQPAPSGKANLDFRIQGELDLAEFREQSKLGILPVHMSKIYSSVQETGGRGRVDFALHKSADSALQFEGKVALDNAQLRVEELQLTDLKGDLLLSPKEIKADKVRALVAGSPVQIQLALKDYGSDQGTFDLGVESNGVKAGIVTRLLLSSGSLQDPGLVRGSVRYRGPLGSKEDRRFTGTLDLANVQLATRPLLQPLRELTGRVKIDDAGIDFQNIKGLLVGIPANFSGRWRFAEKPRLIFDFNSPDLDVTYLLSQIDKESSDFYANLQAEGQIALGKGRFRSFEFADLKSDVVIDRRVWRLSKLAARSAGGTIQGIATIADRPDTLGLSMESRIQGVPVQSVLDWIEAGKAEMTGKVNLNGKLETVGKDGPERKKNLNGSFNLRIEDGTIGRMRIFVQLLNLLDLSRWFTLQMPDLNKQGIRFRGVTGDFKVTQGVYATQNLLVDSDDLRMTGEGRIDVPKDEIDFVVAVRPFAGIDSAINYIPLIGRGIAAIKNSFMVASFNVKGSIEDPTITPAPLSTLSEVFLGVLGIPKNIIGFGGEEKREEPQRDQPKEPTKEKTPAPSK